MARAASTAAAAATAGGSQRRNVEGDSALRSALAAMLRLQALIGAGSCCWAGGLGALHRQAAGFAAAAAAAHRQRQADLLVVHPAASPRHSLQEAIRLAESLTGGSDVVGGALTGGTPAATAAPVVPWCPAPQHVHLPHRPTAPSPLPAAGGEPESMCIGSAARPRRPSPATFFGSGQVEAAASHVSARQPARVFVNALLSGVQQRNLERAWGRPVLDRVALIIEIFNQRARTAEVRLLASMLVPAVLALPAA